MDTRNKPGCNCPCSCGGINELPSFSAPFILVDDPGFITSDNELLLKDARLRERALVSQLDAQWMGNEGQLINRDVYGRSSGHYYRAKHPSRSVQEIFCRRNL